MVCKLPNSALDDVSEPVSATPSQPSKAANSGYKRPVFVKARPSGRIEIATVDVPGAGLP